MRAESGMPEVCGAPDLGALTAVVRAHLAQFALPAHGGGGAGFLLAAEQRDELSVQYDDPANDGAAVPREAADGLVRCCGALARSGYAVTLIVSPRTLAMYVRPA